MPKNKYLHQSYTSAKMESKFQNELKYTHLVEMEIDKSTCSKIIMCKYVFNFTFHHKSIQSFISIQYKFSSIRYIVIFCVI